MTKNISATEAMFLENGMFIVAVNRTEDFWLNLGDLVGWGRFSRRINRKPGCLIPDCFELVEVRPAHEKAPEQLSYISNVLWRQKEAVEAEKYAPLAEAIASTITRGRAALPSLFGDRTGGGD